MRGQALPGYVVVLRVESRTPLAEGEVGDILGSCVLSLKCEQVVDNLLAYFYSSPVEGRCFWQLQAKRESLVLVGDPLDDVEGVVDEDELLKVVLPDLHPVVMVLEAALQVVEEHELLPSVGRDKGDSVVNPLHHLQQSSVLMSDEVLLVTNQQVAEFIPQAGTLQNLVCLGLGRLALH